MMLTIFFSILFIIGVFYLVRNQFLLRRAVVTSKNAYYPTEEKEYKSILLPNEWKEMEPLTKNTKSYQYVKWGTIVAILLLMVLLAIVLTTDWLGSSYFSVVYLFFVIISAVRHRGNLYICPDGIIINSKFYNPNQIKNYETEKIIKWHELYGLNPRLNNAFKLTLYRKQGFFKQNYVVIEDSEKLDMIIGLLEEQGISGTHKKQDS